MSIGIKSKIFAAHHLVNERGQALREEILTLHQANAALQHHADRLAAESIKANGRIAHMGVELIRLARELSQHDAKASVSSLRTERRYLSNESRGS